jgi:hypothetical protein
MHDRPSHVGVAGGVRARSAVGDLAASSGSTLDGQEGLADFAPSRIPFNTAALDRVLCLEYQDIFGFQAVMD